jgi:autotransporter passenger strand-loop-strand repeat protein
MSSILPRRLMTLLRANATVNFGGQQDIIGTAISTTVNNGGEEFVDGGNASGTTVTVATNT